MERILFKEEQRFKQTFFWWLLIISLWLPAVIVGYQLSNEWQNNSDEVLLLSFVLMFLLSLALVFTWLFKKMRLLVEVRVDGIWFKFPPMLYKWKTIQKEEIEKFEIREYRPIMEYGGWGIKTRWRNRSTAYNVSGNIGLQIYLKNGKKILLGTQRKQAIEHAMNKLMQTEKIG